MKPRCHKCHKVGHIRKFCTQNPSKVIQNEPLQAAEEEITIIAQNLEICISAVKIIDLLGIDLTIKTYDNTVCSRLFKEGSSPITRNKTYIVIEGEYRVEITFFIDNEHTKFVTTQVYKGQETIFIRQFEK